MAEYVVKPNEDVREIANRYNCSIEDILRKNRLQDEEEVTAGRVIEVPWEFESDNDRSLDQEINLTR